MFMNGSITGLQRDIAHQPYAVRTTGVIVECSRCVTVYIGIPITSLENMENFYGYEEVCF